MTSTELILEEAEAQCQRRGVRLTDKRKQIFSRLITSGKALSAYELVDYYHDEYGENIPAMSVYRILEFLESENLVHKLSSSKKYIACSHIDCDHAHQTPQFLICQKCSRVKEVAINPSFFDSLKKDIDTSGFQLLNTQIELNCICQSCAS